MIISNSAKSLSQSSLQILGLETMELDFGHFFIRSLLGNTLKLYNGSHSKSILVTAEIPCDQQEVTYSTHDSFWIEDPNSRQMTKTTSF